MSIVLLKLPLTELIEVDEMGSVKLCGVAGMNWPLIPTLCGVPTG